VWPQRRFYLLECPREIRVDLPIDREIAFAIAWEDRGENGDHVYVLTTPCTIYDPEKPFKARYDICRDGVGLDGIWTNNKIHHKWVRTWIQHNPIPLARGALIAAKSIANKRSFSILPHLESKELDPDRWVLVLAKLRHYNGEWVFPGNVCGEYLLRDIIIPEYIAIGDDLKVTLTVNSLGMKDHSCLLFEKIEMGDSFYSVVGLRSAYLKYLLVT